MPRRQKKPCRKVGCTNLIEAGEEYCKKHKRSNTRIQKMYNRRWHKARTNYLIDHSLCVLCNKKDIITPADVVDHIIPHQGNLKLFWDTNNWQALCHTCHNKKTAKEYKD